MYVDKKQVTTIRVRRKTRFSPAQRVRSSYVFYVYLYYIPLRLCSRLKDMYIYVMLIDSVYVYNCVVINQLERPSRKDE